MNSPSQWVIRFGFHDGARHFTGIYGDWSQGGEIAVIHDEEAGRELVKAINDEPLRRQPMTIQRLAKHFVRDIVHNMPNRPRTHQKRSVLRAQKLAHLSIRAELVAVDYPELAYFQNCHYSAVRSIQLTREQIDIDVARRQEMLTMLLASCGVLVVLGYLCFAT
ncbi:TPA: hypothetical protein JG832_002428 [Enterobacter hormaechei subsp. xiangfangensis]|nr:hypothetical protein [Enterobacter hormaechei subsp. xiangfangensis]HAV1890564.1 hypothetical protein [Enterobacter hormaechei subsp. xiangfangensis]